MHDIWDTNLHCLANRSPILMKRINDMPPDPGLELTTAESGDWTAKKHYPNGSQRFLHSRIDPQKEATLWVQNQNTIMPRLVILGIGLGYQILELFKKYRSPKQAYLIEADEAMFRLALTVHDFSNLIQNTCIHFIVGESISVVEKILFTSLTHPFSCHLVPAVVSSCPDKYAPLKQLAERHLYTLRSREGNGEAHLRDTRLSLARGIEFLLNQMRTT